MTKILARGTKPLNQTSGGGEIEARATNLSTRRKGSQPSGLDLGIKARGRRRAK